MPASTVTHRTLSPPPSHPTLIHSNISLWRTSAYCSTIACLGAHKFLLDRLDSMLHPLLFFHPLCAGLGLCLCEGDIRRKNACSICVPTNDPSVEHDVAWIGRLASIVITILQLQEIVSRGKDGWVPACSSKGVLDVPYNTPSEAVSHCLTHTK